MPSSGLYVTHTFNGGWATDFGSSFYGVPQGGILQIPFLVDAKNVIYELDGGPHKVGGTAKLNTTQLGLTEGFLGLFDYFRSGAAGSTTEKYMSWTDAGKIYQMAPTDVAWTQLKTGLSTTGVPSFAVFNDLLVMSNDSGTDVPMSWDQTTFQNLAGTPPTFSFCVKHKNKMFAAGVPGNPSRLYYSVDNAPDNWTGAGSGSIDIDLNDGDRINGLVSHKDDLWVFKGPNIGSIHRITGSSPTGSDAYARIPFISGLTCAYHNLIFRYGDDIGFMSPWGTVHSLDATAAFGNYNQTFLSFPINSFVQNYLALNRLKYGWAKNDPTRGYVLFAVPGVAQTKNTVVLMMDYRFSLSQPRWALWDAFNWGAIELFSDTNSRKRIFAGGYTGFAWKTDQTGRTNDGAAINMTVSLPFLSYGTEIKTKTLEAISLSVVPYNTNAVTVNWTRDSNAQQTSTALTQGGGGGVFGTALFGTDTFGGGRFVPRFLEAEEGGEFRTVQYRFADTANNSDLEIHNVGAKVTVGSDSMEN